MVEVPAHARQKTRDTAPISRRPKDPLKYGGGKFQIRRPETVSLVSTCASKDITRYIYPFNVGGRNQRPSELESREVYPLATFSACTGFCLHNRTCSFLNHDCPTKSMC
jgi:hypothetical protein